MTKIVSLLSTILISMFCSMVSMLPFDVDNSSISDDSSIIEKKLDSISAGHLYGNILEFETSIESLDEIPLETLEDPLKKYFPNAIITEQIALDEFTHHTAISSSFIVKFKKSDLIFPFHYYW